MSKNVRVRFAPSPTGPLHIGGVRTALYNYLFAKSHQGKFILRIEDTDQNRYVDGSEAYILEALKWCGLSFDEGPHTGGEFGPYRQSERKAIYRQYAEALVASGHAYYAFDSPEDLDLLRTEYESRGEAFSYNFKNRQSLDNSLSKTPEATEAALKEGREYVIRFRTPENGHLMLHDIIRGKIDIDLNQLDDKVLFKSDGMPTYHLAHMVDDHLMEISHVIRGEEWLPSLPLHLLLYQAFGWDSPEYAHLPLIMKPVGKGKLSKRDGEKMGFPVYPLNWKDSQGYRESGYFPEAVINFLALLGWNPGTEQELFSLQELVDVFSLDRVHRAGARFDPEKTVWYNHQYLQMKSTEELTRLFLPILENALSGAVSSEKPAGLPSRDYVEKVVHLLRDRASFVKDIWGEGRYFFMPPTGFNEKAVRKHWNEDARTRMEALIPILNTTDPFSSEGLEKEVKAWIGKEGISFGKIMAPLRLLLVGDLAGPHLFDIMEVLGKKACLDRIGRGFAQLPGTGQ